MDEILHRAPYFFKQAKVYLGLACFSLIFLLRDFLKVSFIYVLFFTLTNEDGSPRPPAFPVTHSLAKGSHRLEGELSSENNVSGKHSREDACSC